MVVVDLFSFVTSAAVHTGQDYAKSMHWLCMRDGGFPGIGLKRGCGSLWERPREPVAKLGSRVLILAEAWG